MNCFKFFFLAWLRLDRSLRCSTRALRRRSTHQQRKSKEEGKKVKRGQHGPTLEAERWALVKGGGRQRRGRGRGIEESREERSFKRALSTSTPQMHAACAASPAHPHHSITAVRVAWHASSLEGDSPSQAQPFM